MRLSGLWSHFMRHDVGQSAETPNFLGTTREGWAKTRPRLRVLLLCDAHGATQTISFHRPLSPLVAKGEASIVALDERQIEVSGGSALTKAWESLEPNVLVMSRYAGGSEGPAVDRARREGAKIVYHIDDNLFAVPRELGPQKFERYNAPARLAALEAAMRSADVVLASTPELAHQLCERLPGVRVVAGEIYCAQTAVVSGPAAPRNGPAATIGYMGTSGHAQDLDMVVPAIAALLERHPRLRFETFGTIKMPAALRHFDGRIGHHEGLADYAAFMQRLAGLGWHIGLAPVIDSPFNRCKADTKWVEYTSAGIAVVASDLPVYHRACADGAGVLVAPDAWEAAIEQLLVDESSRISLIEAGQERLAKSYAPQRLCEQLLGEIEGKTA